MRKLLALTALLAATALSLSACASTPSTESESEALTPLTLRLNWTPYPADHAAYYYGQSLGIFEEHGIDLTIEPGNGSATVLKLVDEGSDPIALVDAATMLTGISKGMDVSMVAAITQTSPMSFVFRADNPIEGVDDIKGSKIVLTQGDALSQVMPAVLESAGLSADDVTLISSPTPAAKDTAVLQGEADALLGFFNEQPLRMQEVTGVEMGWYPFSELGVNTINLGLVVNNDWRDANDDTLKNFLAAVQESFAAMIDNPEAAAAAYGEANNDEKLDLAVTQIQNTIPLLHTKNSEGKPIGWMAEADWDETISIMTGDNIDGSLDPKTVYSNDYLESEQ